MRAGRSQGETQDISLCNIDGQQQAATTLGSAASPTGGRLEPYGYKVCGCDLHGGRLEV